MGTSLATVSAYHPTIRSKYESAAFRSKYYSCGGDGRVRRGLRPVFQHAVPEQLAKHPERAAEQQRLFELAERQQLVQLPERQQFLELAERFGQHERRCGVLDAG